MRKELETPARFLRKQRRVSGMITSDEDSRGGSAKCCDDITSDSAAREQRRREVKEKFHHRVHRGRREEGPEDVLICGVYAHGNYWAGAGREDDAVSDFDEGARRGKGGLSGNACGSRVSARAAPRLTRQVVQP